MITVNSSGEKIDISDLNKLEKSLGLVLPDDYKNFLLVFNGGIPVESHVDFEANSLKLPGEEIKRFYGVGVNPTNDIEHKLRTIGGYIPEGFLYIANTHGGNFFLISTISYLYGHVFYKDHEIEDFNEHNPKNGNLPESIIDIAPSFGDFLKMLYKHEE
ncbi:SMI1/KNR4 family protein [Marinobacter xestospongiae]|uniref:SMI1/KNR4 family protein n=1 Tax=Marinobacter xestospongiae TaxID=994319 RepID=A0ABU3VVM8_9GAMM|nr:SMI1/KNR4 family protein [Marinobacter xestospongiae]MDV2078215.1 SMI1/KNR4 family protein [Marinobacter xestospongiae]